jgi:hypothetical protein
MRTVVWVLLGWVGISVWTGLGSAWNPAGLIPDVAITVVVFLGMRRPPIPLCLAALALGTMVGAQAGAPRGLHESALILCAVGIYRMSGSFSGGGAVFFGIVTAALTVFYHGTLFALVSLLAVEAAFSSWATAALIPGAVLTGMLGAALYHPMVWLDERFEPQRREGALWH